MTCKNNSKKEITTRKKFSVLDYLRQLSIVVMGIVITFVGSNLITQYSEQREIRTIMQLIVDELHKNANTIEAVGKEIHSDQTMAAYMLDANFEYESFDKDTLMKYSGLLQNIATFTQSRDVMELLQNSSLMQKIGNKVLLLEVIQTYESLDRAQLRVNSYYDFKSRILKEVITKLDENEIQMINSSDILLLYKVMMSHQELRGLCMSAPGLIESDYFYTINNNIAKLVTAINKEYDL